MPPPHSMRVELAIAVLLAACAGSPERGAARRYEFDSVTNGCRQQPQLCARVAGEEALVSSTRAMEVMASATRTGASVLRVLDATSTALLEKALTECADQARSAVLTERMGGRSPTSKECNQQVFDEATHRPMTLAMQLGCAMHAVALRCAQKQLDQQRPRGFSLEQRYRYDRKTRSLELVSENETQRLLRQGCGSELTGTLVPDIVIHDGDPLQAQAVYDFKFPCLNTDQTPWRRYPDGHRYSGYTQKDLYEEALGPPARRVMPRWGVQP